VQTPAFFNTSANWGTGAGQIGPGTTVLICGTFTFAAGATNVFSFQGDGTSGHLITLKWDTNAIVQAPYFSTSNGTPGAIETNGHNWVVIDGGTNGIVRNTANGTGLANQQISSMVDAFGSSNIQIEHLHLGPVYVHNNTTSDSVCSNGSDDCMGVRVLQGGSNVTVGPGNTFTDCDVCIFFAFTGGESNLVITGNTFNNANQAIEGGPTDTGTKVLTNMQVDHNTYNASRNWDDVTNNYHHNFFHPFTGHPGAAFAGNLTFFDNFSIGDVGLHPTSMIYLENNNGGSGGTMAPWWVFNNVFYKTNTDVATANGVVAPLGINNGYLLNNTIIDAGSGGNNNNAWPLFNMEFGTGWTEENNILQSGGGYYFYNGGNTNAPTANYNLYYSSPLAQWAYTGGFTTSFTTWKSFCSCDANSLSGTNPSVNLTTFVPGNSAVVMGTNLNSLASGSGIPAVATYLPLDINGNARGSGTVTVGAVNYGSGGGSPAVSITPSPVAFGNQTQNTSSSPLTVTVTNSGTANLTLSASFYTFSGANAADFVRSGGTCANNGTVTPGGSCTVLVVFTPVTTAAESATLTINGNASGSVSLTGTGTSAGSASMSLTPGTWSYGTVPQGTTSAVEVFVLTNTGNINVTLAAPVTTTFSGPNAADFSLGAATNNCQGGQVLTPGQTCNKGVQVTPSTGGAESATVTLSATSATASASLTVNGQAPTFVLTIAPTPTMLFGAVTVGQVSAATTATVTNAGTGSVTLATPKSVLSGTNAADWTDTATGTCTNGLVLTAGQTCIIILTFKPSLAGAETATLTVNGSSSATASTTLTGTGVAVSPVPAPLPWVFAMACSSYGPGVTKCKMPLSAAMVSLPGLAKGDYVLTVPGGLEITVTIK
jgi:hypothetical protein